MGALDLCSHTLQHFADLSAALPPGWFTPLKPGWSRLGVHEFDWLPPSPELVFVPSPNPLNPIYPGPLPHWEIVNGQECADAANLQSEADLVLLMQSSGYFQLVQLAATLRHLATDPDRSETVTGDVVRRRRLTGSSRVVVVGRDGLLCDPEDVTAPGTLEQFACRAVASIDLQLPDRVNQIPTRILLVALSEPAESDYAGVLSEVELTPAGLTPGSASPTVTLPIAETFDWYVEKRLIGDEWLRPTHKQLSGMSGSKQVAFSHTVPANEPVKRKWMRITEHVSDAPLPEGEPRNRRNEPVTFDYVYSTTTTDTRRSAWVDLKTRSGSRNADNIYVAVEETLGSGERLRTYFDMRMHPQLTILPASFFRAERECLDKTTELIDYIETHFSESAPSLPPHVPVTVSRVVRHLADLRASSPAVVTHAIRALARDRHRA